MFSGIIEELGTVKSLDKSGGVSKLQISASKITPDTQTGQSICVNGVCLTVVEIEKGLLAFEVMPETLKYTNLRSLQQGDRVNLERALRVDGRIDGHFVTGHIDGTGIISKRQNRNGDTIITIESSPQLLRQVVLKGSVALDGVSLTVSAQELTAFGVNLIPYTLKNTTLGVKKGGNVVNIECDILAKYIDRFLSSNRQSATSNITPSFLKEHGFI